LRRETDPGPAESKNQFPPDGSRRRQSQGGRTHSLGSWIGSVDCDAGKFPIGFLFFLQSFFEHSRALHIVQLLCPLPYCAVGRDLVVFDSLSGGDYSSVSHGRIVNVVDVPCPEPPRCAFCSCSRRSRSELNVIPHSWHLNFSDFCSFCCIGITSYPQMPGAGNEGSENCTDTRISTTLCGGALAEFTASWLSLVPSFQFPRPL